jgi:hypothetical protein
MSVYQPAKLFEKARRVDAPKLVIDQVAAPKDQRVQHAMPDRHFDLPPVLHGALFTIIMSYLGVMAIATGERQMIVPFAIFSVFVVMFFAVPACWSRMKPDADTPAPKWANFIRDGINIETGHVSAKDALVQIFTLPLLILGWGITIAFIVP